jgi:hypothetical protein
VKTGPLVAAGCTLAVALLLWLSESPDDLAEGPLHASHPAPVATEIAPPAAPLVAAADARRAEEPPRVVTPTPAPQAAKPRPVAVSFRYLGKGPGEGGNSVVIYGGGRTLTVRGPGPVDEDYVVDAMQRDYILLRYVPLGTTQLVELASPRVVLPPAAPEDSAQD